MNITKKGYFDTIQELIEHLNASSVAYAVLRNYDNLLEDEIYMDGHGDIDLICEDSRKLASDIGAIDHPGHIKNGQGNGTHYIVYIDNVEVSLDLRHVGDGYYCEKWQKDILENRKLHNGFYVLSDEDHFFTLVYHAIFQKEVFSVEYQERLKKMGDDLEISIQKNTVEFYVSLLEKHMKERGYVYEYPVDKHVPLHRRHIQDKTLFVMHNSRYIEHVLFEAKVDLMAFLVKIYHSVKRKK